MIGRSFFLERRKMRKTLLLLCVTLTVTVLADQKEPEPLKHRILPLPFVNRGEKEHDWLISALSDALHCKLSSATKKDEKTVVYDYENILNGLQKLLLLYSDITKESHIKRIFAHFGATHIITGEFYTEEGKVSLKLLLYALGDEAPKKMVEEKMSGSIDNINYLLTKVAERVLKALGEEGVEADEKLLTVLPLKESLYPDYAKVLLYRRDEETYEKAVERLTELYQKGCREAPVLFQLGWFSAQKALQTEDADEMLRFRNVAKKFFRDAAEEAFARASNSLGLILYADAHYADAEMEFKKAIKADPKLPVAYFNLGNLYLKIRKFKKALEPLLRAYRLAPADPAVANALGCAFFELEKNDEAEKWFLKAVKLDEEMPEPHLGLALLYDEKNEKKKAAEHYGRYLQSGGEDEEGWISLRLERLRREILKGEDKKKKER